MHEQNDLINNGITSTVEENHAAYTNI
jgi:hypothetical protein